ncbi:MAG: DUF1064 domain-containing protein [Ruminococcus sp.]|nr:DUF1064 domain-containing protein [Ruminococcus sp.]
MKQNKYHNRKTPCRYGHTHDSKREAMRCNELHLMQKAGEIRELETQVKFTLLPPRKYINQPNERAVTYIADFVYKKDGVTVIEDSKGKKTKDYIIKRKMLKDRYCREQGCIFRET